MAVAVYLKTFQALSYERLQAALSDLFGLTLSQGGLMNLLRRAHGQFRRGREAAVSALHRAAVIASDETGVRIEGSNAYHWVFRSDEAVVHHAAPTRAAAVVPAIMDGHRPAVWISDRYTAQLELRERPEQREQQLAVRCPGVHRLAGKGKGKSGGYRTIHYYGGNDVPLFLLALIDKGDRANLTKAERNALAAEPSCLADDYRAGVAARLMTLKRRI